MNGGSLPDWTDAAVHDFISTQLDVYGFELPFERMKRETSAWKEWLWLERHGFDFAYQSLEKEIHRFRGNDRPSGVSLAHERDLLFRIRNVMRGLLKLPPLGEADRQSLLAVCPISNRSHWLYVVPRDDVKVQHVSAIDEILDYLWAVVETDKPDYLSICERIFSYDNGEPDHFIDDYTGMGDYPFLMNDFVRKRLCSRMFGFHVVRTCDLFLAPGMRTAVEFVRERFMDSIRERMSAR